MPSILQTAIKTGMVGANGNKTSDKGHGIAFRFLATDNNGSLSEVLLTDPSLLNGSQGEQNNGDQNTVRSLKEVKGPGANKGDLAVQKTASGRLREYDVTALARKDGRIDVVQRMTGQLLITLRNTDMRKGVHRWVGLAIASDGIFACTSAGDLKFFSIDQEEGSKDSQSTTATSIKTLSSSTEPIKRELPEPLQVMSFEPSSDPTHFAYGGEEIPLSVWDARQAITPQPEISHTNNEVSSDEPQNSFNEMDEETNGLSASKIRKRKRMMENRAKAQELMWGEVWRAKNLPNDALSLPQRAGILSITFLDSPNLLATGTRNGYIRLFNTTSQRNHTNEFKPFGSTQEKIPVKTLICSEKKTELIAGDTNGRLFVIDIRSGATLYQFKGINGSILAMQSLPACTANGDVTYIVTASADRLLRLHSIPVDPQAQRIDSTNEKDIVRKSTKYKGQTISSQFMREGIIAFSWDRNLPDVGGKGNNKGQGDNSVDKSEEDKGEGENLNGEDDGMWDAMATIDEDDVQQHKDRQEGRSKRRR